MKNSKVEKKRLKSLLKREIKDKGEKIKENYVCCCCGEEHGLDNIYTVEIKGENKKICKGCASAIKGIL